MVNLKNTLIVFAIFLLSLAFTLFLILSSFFILLF